MLMNCFEIQQPFQCCSEQKVIFSRIRAHISHFELAHCLVD